MGTTESRGARTARSAWPSIGARLLPSVSSKSEDEREEMNSPERVTGRYYEVAEAHTARPSIAGESRDSVPRFQIPDLQSFVIRSGNGAPSVRAQRHSIDKARVP